MLVPSAVTTRGIPVLCTVTDAHNHTAVDQQRIMARRVSKFLHFCYVYIRPCCARLTNVITITHVHSTYVIFWHTALSVLHHHMHLSTAGEFRWEKYFLPITMGSYYRLIRLRFRILLPLHINKSLSTFWLTEYCAMRCVSCLLQVLTPTEK